MNLASGLKPKEVEVHKALSIEARRKILDILSSEGPLDVNELSKKIGLKTITLRHHLQILEYAELVETVESGGGVRGRPKRYYRVRSVHMPMSFPRRQYYLLAHDLIEEILSRDGDMNATSLLRRLGEKSGKDLIVNLIAQHPGQKIDANFFKKYIIPELESLGCNPEIAENTGEELVVKIRNCIFDELAKTYKGIICEGHKAFFKTIAKHMGFKAKQLSCMAMGEDACITMMKKTKLH